MTHSWEQSYNGGRPWKYDPAYCEQVIAAGEENLSLDAFSGLINVARSTINNWIAEFPEFAAAVELHKGKRSLFIQRAGNKIMTGEAEGNPTLVIFGLKNVSPDDFRDKRDVEHSGAVSHEHALSLLK